MLSMDSTHDLKIAIQMMIACAQMIRIEAQEKDSKLQEYANILVENGREAVDYLQKALDAGCSSYFMLDAVREDAAQVVAEAVRKFAPRAKQMDVRLLLHTPGEEICFSFDAEKLTRIALNLISNALKYAHSRVVVRAQRCEEDFVLEVRDDGAGFDGDLREDAYRGEENGVGLVEVRHFAHLHGGRALFAREGGETVMRVILPIR